MSTKKYASGYEKLKRRKKKLIESQKGSMDKFVITNKQNITQNLDENITNEQEILQKDLEDNEMIQLQNNSDVQFCNTTNLDNELQKNLNENENNETTRFAEESFRIDYFLYIYIVDKTISSIENRFE